MPLPDPRALKRPLVEAEKFFIEKRCIVRRRSEIRKMIAVSEYRVRTVNDFANSFDANAFIHLNFIAYFAESQLRPEPADSASCMPQ